MNTAIVVLGEKHNPSILHPSFLRGKEVVPREWEPDEEQCICTPAFSEVKYKNAIVFTVDADRLQIKDERPSEDVANSPVVTLATAYVELLPHVPYKAVGINFAGGVEKIDPGPWLIDRYIRSGPWREDDLLPQAVNIQFQYPLDPGTVNVSLSPGQYLIEGVKQIGVVFTVNYHQPIPVTSAFEGTKEAMGRYADRLANFWDLARRIVG